MAQVFLSYLSVMIRLLALCLLFCCLKAVAQPLPNNYLTGRTTGSLPYLQYGLGEDRLGGAKMTYLDTLIMVKVVDSTKDDYEVQLSKFHLAWLPKVNFKTDSLSVIHPYYLTESWKVFGDDKYDYVTIALDEKLPYRSIQEINPSKIVVDIFGVTSNTNWITQLTTAKEIKNAYYEQPEDDVFRVIIELKHQQHWGYSIYYEEKKLVIRVNRQPPVLSLNKLKIAIDAGHGGDNTGATGIRTGIEEKNYTLKIAKELEKALKKEKAKVFMTRQKDTTLSMAERTMMLRQETPQLLISIHLNSSDKESTKGVSTYYRYIGFRPLTQTILKRMLQLGLDEFGNVGNFNFSLSGPTEYPNCLVEVAFLSNKGDEKKIRSPQFHKAVAAKIVLGIKDWLKSMQGQG
ncbi:MAG: N-acetylmuramoyl-L-alanine amidase [Bacteroidota bacterium]|nr:N-acetylmuramoyl-L-alanine amidase [Bacteroidota bacterium]